MATLKILLLKAINDLGNEGDQVEVRAGYARNYLFREKIAIPINRSNKKQIQALIRMRKEREAKDLINAEEASKKLKNISIAIAVKTGSRGKMFGAIMAIDIVRRLYKENIKLEKKKIILSAPIKTLGKHLVRIKLHKTIIINFEFEVVSENPIEEDKLK